MESHRQDSVFDLTRITSSWGGPADETYRMILGLFASDAASLCETADSAWRGGDSRRLALVAHSLKGAAANVGAAGVERAAHDLEQAVEDGERETLAARIAALQGAWQAALRVITAGGPHGDG